MLLEITLLTPYIKENITVIHSIDAITISQKPVNLLA